MMPRVRRAFFSLESVGCARKTFPVKTPARWPVRSPEHTIIVITVIIIIYIIIMNIQYALLRYRAVYVNILYRPIVFVVRTIKNMSLGRKKIVFYTRSGDCVENLSTWSELLFFKCHMVFKYMGRYQSHPKEKWTYM